MSKIQIISRHQNGCDWYRCVLPAIYLQKDIEWCKTNSIEMLWIAQQEHKIDCDILIYNKLIATDVSVLRSLQDKGMKIIVDIDDYWILSQNHAHYDQWMTKVFDNQKYSNAELTIQHITNADLVICTSMRLQEKVREYNKNTVVIPNALPFGEGIYQPGIREPHDKMGFLYAGGVSHLPDVQLLSGKFKRIGTDKSIIDYAEFIIAGYEQKKETRRMYNNREDYNAKNDKFTTETKSVKGPYDQMVNIFSYTNSYRVIPSAPVNKYLSCYDLADVSLVPLVDSSWNAMKSELKLLEAATRSIPCIVSNVSPYSDLRPCEGVMWVENADDWIPYIKKCIREPNWVKDMGHTSAKWIKEMYDLKVWNETRKQVFANLV